MEGVRINPIWWLIAALSALLVWQSYGDVNRGAKSVYRISSEGAVVGTSVVVRASGVIGGDTLCGFDTGCARLDAVSPSRQEG